MARLAFLALIAGLALPAQAADIAVDLSSGSVLTATDADAPRIPASLTKLMTAYVAFEALQRGAINGEQQVTVSPFASKRPPVKLGLKAGAEIGFTEVLGAAIVGSKNDAAVVVAEAVAGSEAAFVLRMNDAARRLGMSNTRFANATGLPAPGQQTTARDIAILARALLSQFPERAALFSKRAVTAMGRRVSTTNPLFGRIKGAEGLKTGFTCAGGYSIAALIERDGRRVIAVTLGHTSKDGRLRAARGLIEASFKLDGTGESLTPAARDTRAPPDIGACKNAPARLNATDVSPEERALYAAELARARLRTVQIAVQTDPQPRRAVKSAPTPAPPPPLSGWAVFLGAFSTEERARDETLSLARAGGGLGRPRIERRRRDGRILAIIDGLDRQTASRLCKLRSSYCVVLTQTRLLNPKARWRR